MQLFPSRRFDSAPPHSLIEQKIPRLPLTPISPHALQIVARLDLSSTFDNATPERLVRSRATTMPSITSNHLRPLLASLSQRLRSRGISPGQTLSVPVPASTGAYASNTPPPTRLASQQPVGTFLNEPPQTRSSTSAQPGFVPVPSSSASKKRKFNGTEEDPKPRKKSQRKSFKASNPDVARCMSTFVAFPSTTSRDVTESAGPSSAPPHSIPFPSAVGPQSAYPPQPQGLVDPGYQPAQIVDQYHQPLPFSQNGMQHSATVSRPTFPRMLLRAPSFSDGTLPAFDSSSVQPARGGIGIVYSELVGPGNIPIGYHPGSHYPVQLLTGARLAYVRMVEGPNFYGNELYDPYTQQQWVLRIVPSFPYTPAPVPSSYFQVAHQLPAPAFYPTAQVPIGTPLHQLGTVAAGPSAPSSLQYVLEGEEIPANAPMDFGAMEPSMFEQPQYSWSPTYAPAPQMPLDTTYASADLGTTESLMAHSQYQYQYQQSPAFSSASHTPPDAAYMSADSFSAPLNFGAMEPSVALPQHAYSPWADYVSDPHMPVDVPCMADGSHAPLVDGTATSTDGISESGMPCPSPVALHSPRTASLIELLADLPERPSTPEDGQTEAYMNHFYP
ncbi:hypothetical protein B0H12DRAFT_1070680 [Mycena haematopus]|nr:hypothetical protein B0H12DRAFT_1070680 [Mycena haematopus]